MQIKQRGRRILFLRASYDPAAKRTKQKHLGSISAGALELSPELAATMTQEERDQFVVWVEKQVAAERAAKIAKEINDFPETMREIAGYVMRGAALTPGQAKGMWDGMALLRRQLTRAGYTKPHLTEASTAEGASNDRDDGDS